MRSSNHTYTLTLKEKHQLQTVSNRIITRLQDYGFIIHFKVAHTGTIYILLDCGLTEIRVGNHLPNQPHFVKFFIGKYTKRQYTENNLQHYPISALNYLVKDVVRYRQKMVSDPDKYIYNLFCSSLDMQYLKFGKQWNLVPQKEGIDVWQAIQHNLIRE